jgi:hypothetical protein
MVVKVLINFSIDGEEAEIKYYYTKCICFAVGLK